MAHIGVKNRTEAPQVLLYDGRPLEFAAGQVRLVEGIPPDFISSRMHVSHKTKKNQQTGEIENTQVIQGLRLFDVLTIDEALKAGARPDEDPRVLAARKEAEAKAKERKSLLEDLKASLVEEGWVPPKTRAQKQEAV